MGGIVSGALTPAASTAFSVVEVGESYADKTAREERERLEKLAQEAKKRQKARIPAPSYNRQEILVYMQNASNTAFGEEQWPYLDILIGKESGLNPHAQNPRSTAYGVFQFLDATWRGVGCKKTADYKEQVRCGLLYIKARYGSPQAALAFHRKNGWY